MVLTIADVWLPPPSETKVDDSGFAVLNQRAQARIVELREAAKAAVEEAKNKAGQAAQNVKSSFPGWTVSVDAFGDSPAWGIVRRAEEWHADLIVMGSHGMSSVTRAFIGSVSQRVMTHASCSVRVAREDPEDGGVTRLIVGFDGSADAEAAVREVSSRSWPENTEVQLMTLLDDRMRTAIASRIFKPQQLKDGQEKQYEDLLAEMAESAAERLRAARLKTTFSMTEGDPKSVLLETADKIHAHCIFLGATGLRGLRKLLLGSVSSGVTAAAPCTVEIVRPRTVAGP
jgi:nucleotide-binding universal stress UspA family protein